MTKQTLRRRPWVCPGCSKQFHLSTTYATVVMWTALGVALGFFILSGLHGWQLAIAVAVMWFPLFIVITLVARRILPTFMEPYTGPVRFNEAPVSIFGEESKRGGIDRDNVQREENPRSGVL